MLNTLDAIFSVRNEMNLLLVEDNKRITEVIFDYFEIKGISLDYAHNGSLGLELASNNFYDLIKRKRCPFNKL